MNFGTPVPLLIGIVLILIAVILFFLDRFKPGYKRDSDVIYAVLFLVAGIIALSELTIGILQSLQLMIFVGTLIALLIENVRRRTPNNAPVGRVPGGEAPFRGEPEPARGYRDYDRPRYDAPPPRSDIYAELEAEEDMMPPVGNGANVRRIRGSRDERRSSRDTGYSDSYNAYTTDAYTTDTYAEETPRERRERRRSQSSANDNSSSFGSDDSYAAERPRRRKQLQLEPESSDGVGIISYSDATSAGADTTESYSSRRRKRPSESRVEPRDETTATEEFSTSSTRSSRRRPRPSRPAEDLNQSATDGEYVDYKPIKPLRRGGDQESDNDFDNTPPRPEF